MTDDSAKNIYEKVSDYYSDKVREFGASPRGVDWKDESSVRLRFQKLAQILPSSDFTVLDYGCGYGALYGFLAESKINFNYIGYDIAPAMLDAARLATENAANATFTSLLDSVGPVDFVIASGIFNVRLEIGDDVWRTYIIETIERMFRLAGKGLSFNVLTSYSDIEKRAEKLHYANPLELFDFCKQNLTKYVTLVHDYQLWEFTMELRKTPLG